MTSIVLYNKLSRCVYMSNYSWPPNELQRFHFLFLTDKNCLMIIWVWLIMLKGKALGEHFLTKLVNF
jgi:hypothetical protein